MKKKLIINDKILGILPCEMLVPLAFSLAIYLPVYVLTRFITANWYHFDLTLPIDNMFPRLDWTVAIYFGSYLFWASFYILGCLQDRDKAYRFLAADLIAKTVCGVLYLVMPTIKVRPEIVEPGFWAAIMRYLYTIDTPDNLFPSMHCMVSWLCFIAVRRNKNLPVWSKILAVVLSIAVFISTLTTKQHVVADIAAGVFVAEASLGLATITKIENSYRTFCEKIYRKVSELLQKHFGLEKKA